MTLRYRKTINSCLRAYLHNYFRLLYLYYNNIVVILTQSIIVRLKQSAAVADGKLYYRPTLLFRHVFNYLSQNECYYII